MRRGHEFTQGGVEDIGPDIINLRSKKDFSVALESRFLIRIITLVIFSNPENI